MRLNGCHNRPRERAPYPAQNGYFEDSLSDGTPHRAPRWVLVPDSVMSLDCQYSQHTDDPKCAGCCHKKTLTGDQNEKAGS